MAGKLGLCWHVAALSLQSVHISSHDLVSQHSLSLLITIATIRLRDHTNSTGLHPNLTTSAKTVFPTKVTQIGTQGGQNQNIASRGNINQPTTSSDPMR